MGPDQPVALAGQDHLLVLDGLDAGCRLPYRTHRIFLKFWMNRFGHTATLIASQVPIAEWHRRIQTRLWRCHARSTRAPMLIASNLKEIHKENESKTEYADT